MSKRKAFEAMFVLASTKQGWRIPTQTYHTSDTVYDPLGAEWGLSSGLRLARGFQCRETVRRAIHGADYGGPWMPVTFIALPKSSFISRLQHMSPTGALEKAMRLGMVGWDDQDTVLPAIKLRNGETVAWCRYCQKLHYHGAKSGHRVAHCSDKTPYSKHGYTLELSEWIVTDDAMQLAPNKPVEA